MEGSCSRCGQCTRCSHCSSRYDRAGSLPPSFAPVSLIPAPPPPVRHRAPKPSAELTSQQLHARVVNWAVSDRVQPLFSKFLQAVVKKSPSEFDCIQQYQCPSGSIEADITHLLHWPPDSEDADAYSSILQSANRSTDFLKSTFPNIKDHLVLDLYCKRENLCHPNGERKTPAEIYGGSPTLHLHYVFAAQLLCNLKHRGHASIKPCIILWGSHVHEWFSETLSEASSIVIDSTEFAIYRLHHPEDLLRWASPATLALHSNILENISEATSTNVDLSTIKKLQERRSSTQDNSYSETITKLPLDVHSKDAESIRRLRDNLENQKAMALREIVHLRENIKTLPRYEPSTSVFRHHSGGKRKRPSDDDSTSEAVDPNEDTRRLAIYHAICKSPASEANAAHGASAFSIPEEEYRYQLRFHRLEEVSGYHPNCKVHMATVLYEQFDDRVEVIFLGTVRDSTRRLLVRNYSERCGKEFGRKIVKKQYPDAISMFLANPDAFEASVNFTFANEAFPKPFLPHLIYRSALTEPQEDFQPGDFEIVNAKVMQTGTNRTTWVALAPHLLHYIFGGFWATAKVFQSLSPYYGFMVRVRSQVWNKRRPESENARQVRFEDIVECFKMNSMVQMVKVKAGGKCIPYTLKSGEWVEYEEPSWLTEAAKSTQREIGLEFPSRKVKPGDIAALETYQDPQNADLSERTNYSDSETLLVSGKSLIIAKSDRS